jgi:hypothetical protein
MAEKHEFASPAWFEALHDAIQRLAQAAGSGLDGVRWTVCEVFTDVPEHIAQTPDRRAAWHCRVRGQEIAFGLGEIDDADFKVIADYQTVLPLARLHLGDDPKVMERVNETMMKAVMEGRMQIHGDLGSRPAAFATLHDEMVRVTA